MVCGVTHAPINLYSKDPVPTNPPALVQFNFTWLKNVIISQIHMMMQHTITLGTKRPIINVIDDPKDLYLYTDNPGDKTQVHNFSCNQLKQGTKQLGHHITCTLKSIM